MQGLLVSIDTGAIAKLVYGCCATSTAFPPVNGCLLNSEKLFSQLQRKGSLILCLKLPFNDRSDDIGCTAAMMVPHLRAHAASATCQNANVGIVRSPIIGPDCSEKAAWKWPNLTPMNGRNREILCDAINSMPRLRGVSASAKSA